MTPAEALALLLAELPMCCACEMRTGVIMNADRWWLCEPCWSIVPCARERPTIDMRRPIRIAYAALKSKS